MSRRKKAVWVSIFLTVLAATVGIPDWVRDVAVAIGSNKAEEEFLLSE
jgi:hypothetical protein